MLERAALIEIQYSQQRCTDQYTFRKEVRHVDHMSSSNRQASDKIFFRWEGIFVHQIINMTSPPPKKKNLYELNQEKAVAREVDLLILALLDVGSV